MSKLFTRATVAGTSLTGASLKATLTALWDALNTVGLSDVARTTLTANATLTTTQCGLLLVDATSGNITLTLPASGAASDDAFYNMRRIDSTANTVTVQRAGSDTIEGGTSFTLPPNSDTEIQLPGGSSNWRLLNSSGNGLVFATGGTSTAYTISPPRAITAYSANQSFDVLFSVASGTAPTLQINGVATPPNLVKELGDGSYVNIAANDITANHRSRVTLLSPTQALVERLPAAPPTRFFCVFNGGLAGTNAPLSGYGVTSVTRNSAGNYTVNLSTTYSDNLFVPAPCADNGAINVFLWSASSNNSLTFVNYVGGVPTDLIRGFVTGNKVVV
ncbi:hypothetical protein [Polaromonas jejuensis]|uniref:Uncharacterized protein n=1 Tax=Polaromonas jejuensis TaxID=457502 RepID=A0ABW0QHC9_9BURK|nr:hypothetical protein [Polaromonas jejuensis]